MRGTAAGECVVSQANTKDFEDGYDRVFGKREPERGRWVFDEEQHKFVDASDYIEPERALDAPIMAGRFYEGTQIEGNDVGSRARYKEYLRVNGCTHSSDYVQHYKDSNARKERMRKGDFDHKERRENISRAFYDVVEKNKRPQRRYEDEPY